MPTVSIQRSPQGTYVYVARQDNTVESRPVVLGAAEGDDTSVKDGISVGETVVVDGAERLRDGAKIDVPIQGKGSGGGKAGDGGAKKKRTR